MAWFLRAGHSIAIEAGNYIVRLGDFAFKLSPEEFTTSLWAVCNRFLGGEYADLDVRDAVVVDIGAYIGDSVLYFVQQGAYRVHAYEPFGVTFAAATANIELSHAGNRVQVVNAGVASRSGSVAVAAADVPSPLLVSLPADGWPVGAVDHGETVRLISFGEVLDQAVAEAGGRRIVCKIDCEGAEFDILLGAPLPEAFAQVRQLIIETHRRSPAPLAQVLESQGFTVRVDRTPSSRDGELAMMRATRA